MFGIANQLLAALALCLVTTLLINSGRARYAWTTLLPLMFVTATTMSAGVIMVEKFGNVPNRFTGPLNLGLTVFVMASVGFILLWALSRWILVLRGAIPQKNET
jgi:carbon starvation protein